MARKVIIKNFRCKDSPTQKREDPPEKRSWSSGFIKRLTGYAPGLSPSGEFYPVKTKPKEGTKSKEETNEK